MSLKLVIGCGPLPIHPYHKQFIDDSWVLIDLYVKHPKIIKMDARKLEYPALSVEEIYSSHLLEHLAKKEILPTLKEWFRVLKKGGRLRLNVPDFNWAVKCFLKL
jgi:predicted SAM-dependent methyltransferase